MGLCQRFDSQGDRGFGKEIVVEVRRKSVLTEVSRNRVTRKGIRRVAFALPVFYVEGVILKLSDLALISTTILGGFDYGEKWPVVGVNGELCAVKVLMEMFHCPMDSTKF